MSFNRKYLTFGKTCSLPTYPSIPVQNNLAITPSRMAELVEQGIPVSSSVLSDSSFDGVSNPSWELPIERVRGVDVATVWNHQKDARSRIFDGVTSKSD